LVELSLTAAAAVPGRFTGDGVAVVIDVLRATTSLTVARAAGAGPITAAATPEQARALRERLPDALLCGERDGLRIPGFDLGNSPFEYGRDRVAGRALIFASTNGSQALQAAGAARRCWLAAFVNLAAVVEAVAGEPRVWVIASGKLGHFAIEDTACAGLLCRRLAERGATLQGAAARAAATLAVGDAAQVKSLVEGAPHARALRALGPEFARDVEFCAGLDVMDHAFTV